MELETKVAEYWQSLPNGTVYASSLPGTREYYDEVEAARYALEPFIPGFAEFPRWSGKKVLEVGIGAGTDFVNFARAGATLTGIDLTPAAARHTEQRLALENLHADVRVGSGESLPFGDDTFDLVYSWGVVHHAARPERVVRELHRVLAPGGEVRVMLYGRHSWVAYRLWLRHALLLGRPWCSLAQVIAAHMESPGTQAYTRREIDVMFRAAGFESVRIEGFRTPWDRKAAGPIATAIRLDWFLGIVAH